MAERAINQKKAQFLNSFSPVTVSFDELVREKLECGKFPLTKTAWIKVVATVSPKGLATPSPQQLFIPDSVLSRNSSLFGAGLGRLCGQTRLVRHSFPRLCGL